MWVCVYIYIYDQVYGVVIRECDLYNLLGLDIKIYIIFIINLLICIQ